MTTDELIDLVAERDTLQAKLSAVHEKLQHARRVAGGHYVGSSGRCLHVTEESGIYCTRFELVSLEQQLLWKA